LTIRRERSRADTVNDRHSARRAGEEYLDELVRRGVQQVG